MRKKDRSINNCPTCSERLRNGGLRGELSLLVALNHCDSAQRASASQPGSTAQVSTAATRFALKGKHRPALRNPFRVRVQTGYQPGAAFIRIRGFTCPRLTCVSLSGSVAVLTSSINANTFNTQTSPRTSFVDEPYFDRANLRWTHTIT